MEVTHDAHLSRVPKMHTAALDGGLTSSADRRTGRTDDYGLVILPYGNAIGFLNTSIRGKKSIGSILLGIIQIPGDMCLNFLELV